MAQQLGDRQAILKVENSRRKQSLHPVSCFAGLVLSGKCETKGVVGKLTDARSKNPWIVEITLPAFDQENLKVIIQIRQSD